MEKYYAAKRKAKVECRHNKSFLCTRLEMGISFTKEKNIFTFAQPETFMKVLPDNNA